MKMEKPVSDRLVWVNDERTVLVERYENGATIYVSTREDPDHIWGPPITCNADPATAKIMGIAAGARQAVLGRFRP